MVLTVVYMRAISRQDPRFQPEMIGGCSTNTTREIYTTLLVSFFFVLLLHFALILHTSYIYIRIDSLLFLFLLSGGLLHKLIVGFILSLSYTRVHELLTVAYTYIMCTLYGRKKTVYFFYTNIIYIHAWILIPMVDFEATGI